MNLKSIQYFDVHGHPNFAAYKEDRDEVIRRALDAGVWMTAVGTQKDTSREAVELAEKYEEGVYAIVGLHPIHTDKSFHDEEEIGQSFDSAQGSGSFTSRGEEFDYEYYKKLAENPKTVAIGECGLDYFRLEIKDSRFKEKQEEVFREHIELAAEVQKPLMLHLRSGSGRSAYNDAFSVLKSYTFNLRSNPPGDLHFFAGTIEEARPYLDAGFYFSFTGPITYPPRKGQKEGNYDALIRYLPLDRIMAETDCPYVAPLSQRGKRNEPAFVVETIRKIAEIRGADFEKIRAALLENSLKFFGLRI